MFEGCFSAETKPKDSFASMPQVWSQVQEPERQKLVKKGLSLSKDSQKRNPTAKTCVSRCSQKGYYYARLRQQDGGGGFVCSCGYTLIGNRLPSSICQRNCVLDLCSTIQKCNQKHKCWPSKSNCISFSKDCKTIDKKQKLIIDWAQYPTPAGYNMRSYFRCPNRPRCNWNPYNRGRDIATRGCGSKNKKRLVVIHDTCRIHSKRASSCTWPAPDSDGTIDMAKPHQDFESVSKFGALR